MCNNKIDNLDHDDIRPVFLKIPPQNIVLLKCLIESYEGIAEVRTLDKEKALIVILAMNDTYDTIFKLLESEKPILDWEIISKPDFISQDWLLSDS